jgi:anion-transporting  ArsA/GET3 family ATPase
MNVLARELLIVTGKGGVGKTTIAAGLAFAAASSGQRVLAIELDAKGDLDACFMGPTGPGSRSAGRVGFAPKERLPHLFSMIMDPEESLKEYLRLYLKIPVVTRIGVLSNVFDFVANAAPGVREIVTVGKFAYEVRERNYDLVVVDATATGHVLGQLDAPQAINELVGAGLIRSQTDWMRDILIDAKRTGVVAVTTAEEMPVVETIELISKLKSQVGTDLAAVVVNRVLDEPFSKPDEEAFRQLESNPVALHKLISKLTGSEGDIVPLLASVNHAIDRRRSAQVHLSNLLAAIGKTPVAFVPWLGAVRPGAHTTERVSDILGEELGW